ncbi:MAG: hypothetical protein HWE25_06465 [Alphaproteobacteria bacterium]|nr:hypothetical protein [Alphaproteobacteria bacterium]
MIARKLMNLVVSLVFLGVFLSMGLKIDPKTLIPPEMKELLMGFVVVGFLFVAFRIAAYISATDDERAAMRKNVFRFLLAGPVEGSQAPSGMNPALEVRESRVVMILDALGGIIPLILIGLVQSQFEIFDIARHFLWFIAALIVFSSVSTLLQAVVADDLVSITHEGLMLPQKYTRRVPWKDIRNVVLRHGKHGHFLYVRFDNPGGPSMWRGVFGRIKAYFAKNLGEGVIKVSLEHANQEPGNVRGAIDFYLAAHGKSVELPGMVFEPKPTMREFMKDTPADL